MRRVIHWLKNNFFKKGHSDPIESKKLDLGDRILVLGDSHVRSYANNPNFFPVFLGQGRLHNFTSTECAGNYAEKAIRVLERVESETVLFVLGEPDTRFALGLGWLPWEIDDGGRGVGGFTDQGSVEKTLAKSVSRISSFLNRVCNLFPTRTFYVISVHPVEMDEQNQSISLFNRDLKKRLKNQFVDCSVNGESLSNQLIDPVHHGGGIQPIVEDTLFDLRILSVKSGCLQEEWESERVRELFTKNDRFGCYVPESINMRVK